MPPLTRSQAQRQRENEDHDMDDAPATPPSTPPSTPTDESGDDSSEERYREYTPDNMSDDREASPTRLLVIERLLEAGVPPKDKPCPICKDDFPEPTADCPHPAVRLPCNHYFCEECITRWLMDPWFDTCPCCRRVVIKYEPGTGLPESEDGEDENDPQQENTAPPAQQNTALALTPGQQRIAALQREIFIRDEEIRLYNNAIRQAQQAPATRAPLRDITDAREFRERPNEESRLPQRMPLSELTNGSPTRTRGTTLQGPTTRDAQRHQAIRDADRARANRANRVNRVSIFQEHRNGGAGGPIRGRRHPLQDVTNASSPIQSPFEDIQPQQNSRDRPPVQAISTVPSTPSGRRSRLNRSRSPSLSDLTDPRTYCSRRAPIQLPQLRLPPGQLRSLTPSDHGRDGRRTSNRSTRSAASSSIYTLAPSEPLSTGSTVFTLAPEYPAAPQPGSTLDAMLRSDARPGFFDAEAMIPDRFSRGNRAPDSGDAESGDSDSDSDDDSDAETAGRRTPRAQPAAGSAGVRRLLWSRSSVSPTPNPQRRPSSSPTPRPSLAPNLNATWTPSQGRTLTARISVALIRDQRALLLNAIRFAGRGQAEEAFRAMVRVAESADGQRVVGVEPLFRALEQAGRDELVALARGQESGVASRMNSPLRRRRIYGGGGGRGGQAVVVGLRPEIRDAVRRLARRVVNLLRG